MFRMAARLSVRARATPRRSPLTSVTLALSAEGAFLVVANPDANTVSFFDLRNDRNRRVAQVPVQVEPNGVAFMPDGRYVVKSFATDDDGQSVCAYGVFSATHTGEGGPCPPTGKSTTTDYVYVMECEGDKIRHMTKIWNAGWATKELGWN